MINVKSLLMLALFGAALATGAKAQETPNGLRPVVVELFTSQSCSSCPPAEANFRRIAADENVVALEWHVDYWDDLRVGRAGRWKDPFSDPTHTERQRSYNYAIRQTRGVYTPQAIIDGQREAVGSRVQALDAIIEEARGADRLTRRAAVSAERKGDKIMFRVDARTVDSARDAEAVLVTFIRSIATRVGGGENNGRTLAESHVVTDVMPLGPILGSEAVFSAAAPRGDHLGCALLVEKKAGGAILGAQYCP